MRVYGNDIVEDANSMFDYINEATEKDFTLEPIDIKKYTYKLE